MSDGDTVRLVRGGYDPVDILPSQLTPASVARVFSVSKLKHVNAFLILSVEHKN